jgi:phosphoglycerate dehydrogenase-like enzyme
VLRALGPRGILINIARGTVVDPVALIAALRDRAIAGAGLDVFEGEPNIPEAIRALDNVIMTPHIGAITFEAFDNGLDLLRKNLAAHFAGGKVLTPVYVPDD